MRTKQLQPFSKPCEILVLAMVVSCPLALGGNLTTTNVQGGGANWTAPIWKKSPGSTAVSPVAGNTYECIFNGTTFGNGHANTRIRNPVLNPPGVTTFPGDSLTLDADTEIRIKGSAGMILNFPGVGGNPGLILNGGFINVGDETVFLISGKVHVAAQSYVVPADAGGGAVRPLRGVRITGQLSGSGNLVIFQAGTNVPQEIAGSANTFSGEWIVKAGWLLGSGADSLGTNSITIDPGYFLGLDPSILEVAGPAVLEPGYNLNSAGTLTLVNGGQMRLHQDCYFSAATIEGAPLGTGKHSYAELAASFSDNFPPGGSGSVTIRTYTPPAPVPPSIVLHPREAILYVGNATQLLASATGTLPLSYRWQKGTNNVFVNVANSATVSGATSDTLVFSSLGLSDTADYRLVVTNSAGAATSQVAKVTILLADTVPPSVTAIDPAPGLALTALTQLRVTFSEDVFGVQAQDLFVNATPAVSVTGSGSNYVFTFLQPWPGPVVVEFDSEAVITDRGGNLFIPSRSWNYTLLDTVAPGVASVLPAAGAMVTSLTNVQVFFTEPVTGIDAADLLANGTPATQVSGSGFGPYTFSLISNPQGQVQFTWNASHNIRDISSAANLFVPAAWSVTVAPAAASAALTNIVINEFLAANVKTNGLRDEDLDLDDWIELHNRGTVAVNLAGWSLSDDVSQPAKWTFPATNIPAGGYLVVFASGKDRHVAGAKLHTSFRVSSAGGYLGLYNADFPARLVHAYSPEYPEQRNDISYGLQGSGSLGYFTTPTPGAANSSSSITGTVAAVHFSVKSGFFGQSFNVVLTTTTPAATLVYTTDGSEPAWDQGLVNGNVYTGPLGIGRTTVLRVAAFAPGMLPSRTATRSYFFVEDIVRQPDNPDGYPVGYVWTPNWGTVQNGSRAYYQMDPKIVDDPQYSDTVRSGLLSIPTMSIASPIDGLFGEVNGIYSHPQSRGPAWERACSMELIFPDGSDGTQVDCGVQIQGGTQREPGKNPKHSFKLNFKSEYGQGKLHFPLFPDSAVEEFDSLVLDGGINMWWHYVGGSNPVDQRYRAQCVRDQFTSDLMLATGNPSFRGRFYHLYLNGLYWGLHYVHEMPDDAFAETYFGGTREDYDIIKNTTAGNELVAGDYQAWNTALGLSNDGLTNNSQYAELQQYVDVDNLIDYMIVNHWVGNEDWPHHNWYVLRKRAPGEGFKFMIWDAEHVLKGRNYNNTTAGNAGTPAQIYGALRLNAEFRLRFADHLQKHFFNGGVFYTDPDPALALWDPAHPERNIPAAFYMKRIQEIDMAIVDESARWGGYLLTTNYTRSEHWLRELNNLLGFASNSGNTANYFPLRSSIVLGQYKSLGLFPALSAPVFNQHGGMVPLGFALILTNLNTRGQIYFTTNGTDPRVYGSGTISPAAARYQPGSAVIVNSPVVVKARVLDTEWSPLTEAQFAVVSPGVPLRITELMYNPIGGSAYEFIEIQNIGPSPVDLGGYSFDGVSYTFLEGTIVEPGRFLVLGSAANPVEFAQRYPGVTVAGWFDNALANSGERVALLDRAGNTVVSATYVNTTPWPVAANGGGYSLEIIDPNADPNDPANWKASNVPNGSPGSASTLAPVRSIRINEVMAENAGAVTNGSAAVSDWVELQNTSSDPVSLADWSFTDGSNPRRFVFPPGTSIAGSGYLLIWCDMRTDLPGIHTGFALDRDGETVVLYDGSTNRVDSVSFGPQLTNYTVGRFGLDAAWRLAIPTPGSNNLAAVTAPATNLIINEWLANSAPGASDWLELLNRSSNGPVALSGLSFTGSNGVFQIKSLSFVPPGGFIQLLADEKPGPNHLDLTLEAAGDEITLYDSAGRLVDRVDFGAQAEAISEGRLPNGSATIVTFPMTPSPGASNYLSTYTGPILNEIVARNTSAVYDPRGENPDWVELYNPTAVTYSMAGMSLTSESSKSRWVFPAGAQIPAYGYMLLWCDSSRPARTNLLSDYNTGFSVPAAGDTIRLLNPQGQIVDSISFGCQVRDLSIGRSGGQWLLLTGPTPNGLNAAPAPLGDSSTLRINEWMAAPQSGDDWFEVFNSEPLPVSLTGLYITDDPSITGITNSPVGPLSFVGPRAYFEFIADTRPGQGPAHVNFSLNKEAGTLRLYAADFSLIDAADFGVQAAGVSQGRLPDGAADIVTFDRTPTPGQSNYLPADNLVVNEVLTHTDPPLEDAIELFNPSSNSAPIGGWFISNSEADLKKYRIPANTLVQAGGYFVIYENQLLSATSPFTLNSAHGDTLYVSEADVSGNLTGRRAQVSFGAAPNAASLGRVVTSAGIDFVPLSNRTFGADSPSTVIDFRKGTGLTNSSPAFGPVVINEIMYHPVSWSGTNTVENHAEEFIELLNWASTSIRLYDPQAPTNTWKLDGGVQFAFPQNVSLLGGACALVVSFDPLLDPAARAAFLARYPAAAGSSLYGPFSGRLSNGGEMLWLLKPDTPQSPPHPDAGFVPYLLADYVVYSNGAPWPVEANGTGMSLQRRAGNLYGNEPLNWLAAYPTPGTSETVTDADGDGLPDDWEVAHGLDKNSPDGSNGASGDPDGDGFTNLAEYLAGTDPQDAASRLGIDSLTLTPEGVQLRFKGIAGHTYTLQYRDALSEGAWRSLANFGLSNQTGLLEALDMAAPNTPERFYRLVTPQVP